MILTNEELQRLRRLAEAATPGPWPVMTWYGADDGGFAAIGPHHVSQDTDDDYPGGPVEERAMADAEFIAAANPTVVLALLDWLASAMAERDVAERDRVLLRDEVRLQISRADRAGGQVAELLAQLAYARGEAGR